MLLILTLFIAGLSWFIFGMAMAETNPHKKLILCVMNSLAVILGISSNNRPNFTPLRVFFILLALYGLNVTTIYTSKLITVFTQPAHDQQISTIEEILEAGIPIGRYNVSQSFVFFPQNIILFTKTKLRFDSRWSRRVFRLVFKRQSIGSGHLEKIQHVGTFRTNSRKYEIRAGRLYFDIIKSNFCSQPRSTR